MSQTQAPGALMKALNSLEHGRMMTTLPLAHGVQQRTSPWLDTQQSPMNGNMLMALSEYIPPIQTTLAVSGKMGTNLTMVLGYTTKTQKNLECGGMKLRQKAENSKLKQIQPDRPSKSQLTEHLKSLEPGSTPMVHRALGRKILTKISGLGLMKMVDLVALTLMIALVKAETGGQTQRMAHGMLAVVTKLS